MKIPEKVLRIIQFFLDSKLYGTVTLKIEAGKIVHVKQEQTTLIEN